MKDEAILKRWNNVMKNIGVEYRIIPVDEISIRFSQLDKYDFPNGITIDWMIREAKYWRSCYDEPGNVRHDDCGPYKYQEMGYLDRMIARFQKEDGNRVVYKFN